MFSRRRFSTVVHLASVLPAAFRASPLLGGGRSSPHAGASRNLALEAARIADEANALPPEAVPTLLVRVLDDPNPAMRHSAGMWDQRMVEPLKRILPNGLFEPILRAAMSV